MTFFETEQQSETHPCLETGQSTSGAQKNRVCYHDTDRLQLQHYTNFALDNTKMV